MRKLLKHVTVRLSLRWRLALASFGLLAALLTAMGVIISSTVEQALLTSQVNALTTEVKLATQVNGFFQVEKTDLSPTTLVFLDDPQKNPPGALKQDLQRLINDVLKVTGQVANATVIDTQEKKIFFPGTSPQPLSPGEESAVKQLMDSHETYTLTHDSQGQRQIMMLLPIQLQGHPLALLELNAPTIQTDAAVIAIREILFTAILCALLLAAAFTFPLINVGLRPLVEIERTSRQIAEGSLSLRLQEPGTRDEIGRLAHSFNHMVARLEAMFTRQQRFVSDVSHELRTPLTALGGSLEMLLLEAHHDDPAATRRLLRGMYAETERMQRMVMDLLALTRLDEGHIPFRKEPMNVGALVREIGEQGRVLAQGQSVHWQIETDLPMIYGDSDVLRRVLLNLVENALKFTPPEQHVEIQAGRAERGGVWIEVDDSGCGIPSDALPYIFDRFYRADPARTRAAGQTSGNGLGLAIAKSLLEAQGGTIEIASEVGVGTRVLVKLPENKPSELMEQSNVCSAFISPE